MLGLVRNHYSGFARHNTVMPRRETAGLCVDRKLKIRLERIQKYVARLPPPKGDLDRRTRLVAKSRDPRIGESFFSPSYEGEPLRGSNRPNRPIKNSK